MILVFSRAFTSVLYFLFLMPAVRSDIYSSTAHLAAVFKAEKEIIEQLESYIVNLEAKLNTLQIYIDDFKRVHGFTDPQEVVSNPTSAYQLVKRLTLDWHEIEDVLNDNSWQDLIRVYKSHEKLLKFEEADLKGAKLAILRLQETYQLNAEDLSNGNVLGIQSSTKLTAEDCFEFANYCYYLGWLDMAFEWYYNALNISKYEIHPEVTPEEIIPCLEETINEHDLAVQIGGRHNHIFQHPIRNRTPAEMKSLTSLPTKYSLNHNIKTMNDLNNNQMALCRGKKLRSSAEEAKLNCYLSDRGDPSFYINPIKVEVHSNDPYTVTFHDIIYESEINVIKNFSKPLLQRSFMGGRITPIIGNMRVSMNTWFNDEEEDEILRETLKTVMNRMNRITGLNVFGEKNSEDLQVVNYGIGGHYSSHVDYVIYDRKPEEWGNHSDRLATLMFYLNDVTLGGSTVFPITGVSVWPSKGSALFWYNLYLNGDPIIQTLHAGCPVLYGSKWIATKWIHDINQAFKRPCSLNPRA